MHKKASISAITETQDEIANFGNKHEKPEPK